MAFIQRYATNQTGAITFIGNTLGLARSASVGVPGTATSIGAFITTNTASRFGTYPFGTTSAFASNSSTAFLVLPAGSSVLYAELIWGGSYANGNTNVLSSASNPITFQTPALSTTVSPESATSINVTSLSTYVRTANVTNLVIQGGAGISSATGSVNVVISGFATPVQGTLRGRALISAQEGDVDITGDRALFGPTTSSLTALSGPNNFSTNFFASQINGDDGTLVTTGTFGTTNTVNVAVSAPNIQVTKTSSLAAAVVGNTIRYTLSITNNGVDSVTDTVVTDTIPAGTSFVPGSVLIDGVPFPNASPTAGIAIGNVAPGNTFIVSFQTSVQSLPQTSPQTKRRPKQGKT